MGHSGAWIQTFPSNTTLPLLLAFVTKRPDKFEEFDTERGGVVGNIFEKIVVAASTATATATLFFIKIH